MEQRMDQEKWYHGTEVYFDEWKLPLGKLLHKGGMDSHSGIFFTTSQEYALGAANRSGGLCEAKLNSNAKILDVNNCPESESERYRNKVVEKFLGKRNMQIIHPQYWRDAWKSGRIMKYAPSSDEEATEMQQKAYLAVNAKNTSQGVAAYNELQLLTRNVIEELVISARELGYDAVIGNEIDTLHPMGPRTFKIMFALNAKAITPPLWITKPN